MFSLYAVMVLHISDFLMNIQQTWHRNERKFTSVPYSKTASGNSFESLRKSRKVKKNIFPISTLHTAQSISIPTSLQEKLIEIDLLNIEVTTNRSGASDWAKSFNPTVYRYILLYTSLYTYLYTFLFLSFVLIGVFTIHVSANGLGTVLGFLFQVSNEILKSRQIQRHRQQHCTGLNYGLKTVVLRIFVLASTRSYSSSHSTQSVSDGLRYFGSYKQR